jgi:glycosyltransferase involved in cell wall biosynthesis
MNIVIASNYHYSSLVGGNEQHAHNLSMGLSRAGHQVTCLSTSPEKQLDLPYSQKQLNTYEFLGQLWLSRIPSHTMDMIERADILHVFGFSPLLLQLLVLVKGKVPRIMTYQADPNPHNTVAKSLSRLSQRLIPYACESIITTSNSYQKKISLRWPKSQVVDIPPMIPVHIATNNHTRKQSQSMLKLRPQKTHILCVASLSHHHYYKGIDVLMRAFTQLPPTYQLHLIGDGNRIDWHKSLAQKLGVDKNITFHGSVPNEEMSAWYKSADVFVLPSISDSEGFGLSLIEAMYCETPCITTSVIGPAEEYARKKVCILVEPNNSAALAQAIVNVSNNNSQDMLKRAKQWADSLSLENMTKKTIALYTLIKKSA